MAKSTTPSFIHELKLSPKNYQKDIIEISLNVGRQLYNNGLGELLKRRKLMINSKLYKKNNKLYKEFKEQEKLLEKTPKLKLTNKIKKTDITKVYNQLSKDFGFSEYSIQSYLTKQKNIQFKKLIGGDETQKVASRIWKSVSDFHFNNEGKPKFKRYG